MVPVWLNAVVLCRDSHAQALISLALRERPDPDEHLRIGVLCPFCRQAVLLVVHGDRGTLELGQGLADGRRCLHRRLLES